MTAPNDTTTAAISSAQEMQRGRLLAANWQLIAVGAGLFVLFLALFSYIQFGTDALVGTDGYYHARMGLLIREVGLKPTFDWLPMTILNAESFYDHHLLYHLYLALFSGTEPALDGGQSLTTGAKFASILLPSLAFLAIWWLLRSQGIRWAAVWTLGLFAVSEAFLYRMSMPRAQSAALLILILGLHWLFQERFWLLLPLGFLFVWLYDAFPLLLVIGGAYFLATWMTERRIVWQALAFPAIGIILGLLINPYFPEDIFFIVNHLAPKIGASSTRVGNEWYPYRTWTLVENSGVALVAMVLGTFAWGWRKERMDQVALTLFILTILFAFLLFRSRRFIEYFPAIALIFAVVSFAPLVEEWLGESKTRARITFVALLVLLVLPAAFVVNQTREAVGGSKPADQYADAAIWLHDNTPAGSMVFQTDWDDFTRLFFYNQNNVYTVGLDPTYMELYDAELYDEWRQITQGDVKQPGEVIRKRFGASYVFSDLKHKSFLEEVADDPLLEELYRDKYAVIFAVN